MDLAEERGGVVDDAGAQVGRPHPRRFGLKRSRDMIQKGRLPRTSAPHLSVFVRFCSSKAKKVGKLGTFLGQKT
jgi:hypothetical protein